MSLATFLLVLFSVLLGVAGQLFMKHGVNLYTVAGATRLSSPLSVVGMLTQPFVLAGFLCYGVAALSWLVVLTKAPLSVAYPMLSMGYAAVAVLAWRFFGESMTAVKMLGI